jgi:hypothetical protein
MANSSRAVAWLIACASGVVSLASPLGAQAPRVTLVGSVRDSAGSPLPGVEVWLRGSDLYTHTADNGGFRLPGAPQGAARVTVRRMGFESTTFDLQLRAGQTDSLVVSLSMVATALAGMSVEEEGNTRSKRLLAGFWERRSRGFGHFFTREEIDARDPHEFTDIVRTTAGVSIVTINGRQSIRFSRSASTRVDCPPQYWMDGMPVQNATPDEFPPQDVEALEVYAGAATIPPQFAPRMVTFGPKTCGAIVIWTRLPGS